MSLISVILTLVVIGFLLWLINTFIPMAGSIKTILNIVVVVAVIIWILNVFGILPGNFGIRLK
jgi:hypothetical protein